MGAHQSSWIPLPFPQSREHSSPPFSLQGLSSWLFILVSTDVNKLLKAQSQSKGLGWQWVGATVFPATTPSKGSIPSTFKPKVRSLCQWLCWNTWFFPVCAWCSPRSVLKPEMGAGIGGKNSGLVLASALPLIYYVTLGKFLQPPDYFLISKMGILIVLNTISALHRCGRIMLLRSWSRIPDTEAVLSGNIYSEAPLFWSPNVIEPHWWSDDNCLFGFC